MLVCFIFIFLPVLKTKKDFKSFVFKIILITNTSYIIVLNYLGFLSILYTGLIVSFLFVYFFYKQNREIIYTLFKKLSSSNVDFKSLFHKQDLFLFFIFLFFSSFIIQNFTYYHLNHTSDSLLHSLQSIQNPEFFVWGLRRMAMIIALACSWITNYQANLYVITILLLMVTFGSVYFFNRLLLKNNIISATAFSLLILALFSSQTILFDMMATAVPFIGFFFILLSLFFLQKSIAEDQKYYLVIFAVFSTFLGFSTNPLSIVFLIFGLLFLFQPYKILIYLKQNKFSSLSLETKESRTFYALGVYCLLVCITLLPIIINGTGSSSVTKFVPLKYLFYHFSQLYKNYTFDINIINKNIVSILIIAVFFLFIIKTAYLFYKTKNSFYCKLNLICIIVPLLMLIMMSLNEHVHANHYLPRYIYFSTIIFFISIPLLLFIILDIKKIIIPVKIEYICIILVLCFFASKFHYRTFTTPIDLIGQGMNKKENFIEDPFLLLKNQKTNIYKKASMYINNNCKLIAGDLWQSWPLVWFLNATTKESYYGISHRSSATLHLWKSIALKQNLICAENTPESSFAAKAYVEETWFRDYVFEKIIKDDIIIYKIMFLKQ